MSDAPKIRGICETVLYTDNLPESRAFYSDVLNLPEMMATDTMLAYDAGTSQVLLVFDRAFSNQDHPMYGGVIPAHLGTGPAHMAFHISVRDCAAWEVHLEQQGIQITSDITFPAGGRSLYFNDPSGNVLELATPGHWPNF